MSQGGPSGWWSSLEDHVYPKLSLSNLLANPLMPPTFIRFVIWWAELRKRPLIASINVVNRCNLHCAGCYWTRTERAEDRRELSVEESVQLIHDLWKKGIRGYLF